MIEWYGINKKWFEDYVYCVLKSFEDNFFVVFGECNIVELKIWDLLVFIKVVEMFGCFEVVACF